MEPLNEEARKRFEEKHQQNSTFYSVDELNRTKEEYQRKREKENAPEENVDLFDKTFADMTRSIKSQIASLTSETVLESAEVLKSSVAELSAYLNQSVHFLNPYTILQGQQKITQLFEEISTAQASLAPRKKFAFSKRTAKKEVEAVKQVQSKGFEIKLEGISDKQNETFIKHDEELKEYNCYQLKNLQNCSVFLLGRLKALHMLNLQNCFIYVGAVAGAAHITECDNCEIYVAAHQIRIHQSSETDFYIFVATHPIVESVKNVRFAPYLLKYPGVDEHLRDSGLSGTNNWDQVQDFKWLKQEKSPHWSVLEESLRKDKLLD